MTFNCVLIEDHTLDLVLLSKYASQSELLNVVACCRNGEEAAAVIRASSIDIVISDIDMPGMSGIDLIKSLPNPPAFIFISSHQEFAAECFDLHVTDYIVKPLSLSRFLKAVERTTEYITSSAIGTNPDPVAPFEFSKRDTDYFFIRGQNLISKLYYADILYVESMGDFSKIFTVNGQKHVTLVNLKNLEAQLPVNFKRIHKKYIANLDHLQGISAKNIYLSDKVLPVTESYKRSIMDSIVNKNIINRFSG